MSFDVSDGGLATQYSFTVTVSASTTPPPANSLPYFSPSLINKTIWNTDPVYTYELPQTYDADNNPVTVILTTGPAYVSLISQT